MIKDKTILITGGAGFIGSHLCKELIKHNKVICLDNLFTGKMNNIKCLLQHENFSFINHDVVNPYDIKCDYIFNMACPASPYYYQQDPVKTLFTNIIGALHALKNAQRYNAVVLQASTSEVYGDPDIHPQPESYRGNVNPDGIRACYDEGKRCAETLFFDYHRQYKTKIKVVRIFNTYGPFMDKKDGRVVSNFVVQALANKPITIYGNGEQTRSFCYVDDLVNGLILMAESSDDFVGPCNLGNPGEFTMNELAKIVLEKTHSLSKIVYYPLPQDDPRLRKPDISLANKVLKWRPEIPLEAGLDKTIEYFKSIGVENEQD